MHTQHTQHTEWRHTLQKVTSTNDLMNHLTIRIISYFLCIHTVPFPCTHASTHPQGQGLLLCLHQIATTQAQTSNPVPITFPNFSQCMEARESTECVLYIFETKDPSQHISPKDKKVHCWLCPSKTQNGNYIFFSMLRTKNNPFRHLC